MSISPWQHIQRWHLMAVNMVAVFVNVKISSIRLGQINSKHLYFFDATNGPLQLSYISWWYLEVVVLNSSGLSHTPWVFVGKGGGLVFVIKAWYIYIQGDNYSLERLDLFAADWDINFAPLPKHIRILFNGFMRHDIVSPNFEMEVKGGEFNFFK